MSRLASQAELMKLADVLAVPIEQIHFLANVPPEALRHFRTAMTDRIFDQQHALFRWFAAWVRWVPMWISVLMVRFWLGLQIATRIAGSLPAWRAASIAKHLPVEFMADIAKGLDPRMTRELVKLLSEKQVESIAQVLLDRRDFMTIGRFVGLLPDQVVRDVAASIPDEGDLLEIIFHVDSRERIDHLIHVLPFDRIQRTMLIVSDPTRRALWPKLLALVVNVSDSMKRQLGDLAASQGDEVLGGLILAAEEDGLWEDILPVVACLSREVQRLVVNHPALLEPAVMQRVLQAADHGGLWKDMLTLAAGMNETGRDSVAKAMVGFPDDVLEHIAYAALLRAQWGVALDIVRRLPVEWHQRCLRILEKYTDLLDKETAQQIKADLEFYGIISTTTRLA
ncbi:MAG: hypothetical protein NVS3B3_05170 [Aquirhabdus sp.]